MEIFYSQKAEKQLKKILKSDREPILHNINAAEEDRDDYFTALETKLTNKIWIKHEDIKKELGID